MQGHYFSVTKKWGQFRFLSKKLNQLLESGEFQNYAPPKKQQLLNRLKQLFRSLNGAITTTRLKKVLAGAAILFGLATVNPANAQNFKPGVTNPFGINQDNFAAPALVDIDNDGDLDMFYSKYSSVGYNFRVVYTENIGTAQSPDFEGSPTVEEPFGIKFPPTVLDEEYFTVIDFADMDNDGDLDMIAGGVNTYQYDQEGVIAYFENTGTPEQPAFGAAVQNPFGLEPTYYTAIADVTDLDGDGDFDIVAGEYYGNIKFFENTGTAEEPMFADPVINPFGIAVPTDSYYNINHFADLDNDGDQDLLGYKSTSYATKIFYQENIGTATEPDFGPIEMNPFDFDETGDIAVSYAADIDDDGDLDIFAGYGKYISDGVIEAKTIFYENTTLDVAVNDLLKNTDLQFGPNPTAGFISLKTEINSENPMVNLSLINTDGRILKNEKIRQDRQKINWQTDINYLPTGHYFLKLESGGHFGVIPFEKI